MADQDAHHFHGHYPDLDDKNFHLHGLHVGGLHLLIIVLTVLLISLVLLCLYVRRVCRGRRGGGAPECQLGRSGLDPGVAGRLPVVQLHCREGDCQLAECMCSICLSVVMDGEKVKVLPGCGHVYHPECVDAWLRVQASCPMCRGCIGEAEQGCGAGGAASV